MINGCSKIKSRVLQDNCMIRYAIWHIVLDSYERVYTLDIGHKDA